MRSKKEKKSDPSRRNVAERVTEWAREDVLTELRERRVVFFTNMLLRMIILFIMIVQALREHFENVALCALALLLFSAPRLLRRHTHVDLPTGLEMVVLFFIFAALILGEIREFYIHYPYWDTILHTVNGFCAAAIGLSMLDILNRSKRFSFLCSPIYVALASFCFSMTVGVLWEFFEFGMDALFGFDMQKATVIDSFSCSTLGSSLQKFENIGSVAIYDTNGNVLQVIDGGYLDVGLLDTMADLFVNFVGAAVFAVFGFFYVKHQGNTKIVKNFVMTYKSHPEEILSQVRSAAEALDNAPPADGGNPTDGNDPVENTDPVEPSSEPTAAPAAAREGEAQPEA